MDEPRSRAARRSAMPWGLVGMLAVVFGVERFIAAHDLEFSNELAATAKWSARAAREQAARNRVLLLGDSLVKVGVQPHALERALGRSAINLAVVGGQPPATLAMLRRALQSGARPEAVIVDFQANIIADPPRDRLRHWPEMLNIRELIELGIRSRDPSFLGALLVSKPLASFRARLEIRAEILGALSGTRPDRRALTAVFWRNENVNKGAFTMPVQALSPERVLTEQVGVYFPASWRPDPTHVRYMCELFALARARNVPVFWLLPPHHPAVQERRERLGLDAHYLAFVYAMRHRFPEITIIDGRHSGYPGSVFYDAAHLAENGASALSLGLADVLGSRLDRSAPRHGSWVSLPPYAPAALGPPSENIYQSRMALEASGGIR